MYISGSCVCRCRGCCSLSVCVCVCDLLICLPRMRRRPSLVPRGRRRGGPAQPLYIYILSICIYISISISIYIYLSIYLYIGFTSNVTMSLARAACPGLTRNPGVQGRERSLISIHIHIYLSIYLYLYPHLYISISISGSPRRRQRPSRGPRGRRAGARAPPWLPVPPAPPRQRRDALKLARAGATRQAHRRMRLPSRLALRRISMSRRKWLESERGGGTDIEGVRTQYMDTLVPKLARAGATRPAHRRMRLPSRLALSKDQQVTRTRTRQQNTRQQNKPLTRTQSEQRRNDA